MRDGYRVIDVLQGKVGRSVTSETVAEHVGLKIASTSKVLAELARKGRLTELPQRLGHFKLYRIDANPESTDLDEYYARQQQGPKKSPAGEGSVLVRIDGLRFARDLVVKLTTHLNENVGNAVTVQSVVESTGLNKGFVGRFLRHAATVGHVKDANGIQTRPRIFTLAEPLRVPEPPEVKKAEPEKKGGTNDTSPRVADAFARMAVCYDRIDKRLLEMNARLERIEQAWA